MAGQYGGGRKNNLQLLQVVQNYLTNHDISTSGFAGKWATDNTRFIDVGPEIGRLLGIPAKNMVNGTASVALNDIAGLALMAEDPNSPLTPDQRKGFDKLVTQMGQYAGASDAYSHYKTNSNAANLRYLLNSAMAGANGAYTQAYQTPPATAYPIGKWAQEYAATKNTAGGYGPGGNWTYNQMRQYDAVSNFLGYWPKLDTPTTQAELTRAIASGMSANQIERALYNPQTDTKGILRNTSTAFQQAFPALVQAYKTGNPIAVNSVYEYQKAVDDYQTVMRQYGQPPLTSQKVAQLLTNHVRPQDLQQRVQLAVEAYNNAPQQVKDALASQYGITPAMAINHILDPTKGIEQIKDELSGASMLAAGARAGINKQDVQQLSALVDNPLAGVSQADVNAGIQKANELSYLQQPGVGKEPGSQTTTSAQDVLGATVSGFSPDQTENQLKVNRALQERQQASLAGGQLATTQQGVTGAGQVQ